MSLYLAFLRVKKDEDAPRRCTANAIEMLAATRTPSRFVEEARRDDPLTAGRIEGHSRTLAQASLLSFWAGSALL